MAMKGYSTLSRTVALTSDAVLCHNQDTSLGGGSYLFTEDIVYVFLASLTERSEALWELNSLTNIYTWRDARYLVNLKKKTIYRGQLFFLFNCMNKINKMNK